MTIIENDDDQSIENERIYVFIAVKFFTIYL